jgi:hypothetical protein
MFDLRGHFQEHNCCLNGEVAVRCLPVQPPAVLTHALRRFCYQFLYFELYSSATEIYIIF